LVKRVKESGLKKRDFSQFQKNQCQIFLETAKQFGRIENNFHQKTFSLVKIQLFPQLHFYYFSIFKLPQIDFNLPECVLESPKPHFKAPQTTPTPTFLQKINRNNQSQMIQPPG
jgi:hypothetical protein